MALQSGYLASQTNVVGSAFVRVDKYPVTISGVEAAAGAFSLPILQLVGNANQDDPADWAPYFENGTAVVLSNSFNPLVLSCPGTYQVDLTGFAGEVFFREIDTEVSVNV